MNARQIAFRLFFTCWLVFALHFATNIVRDIYLALAIGDHLSFRVDEYAGLHPDLFEHEGYGWHTGANPGVSMIAAVPYALARPAIDVVVERVNQKRKASGAEPPRYNSPWPMARELYRQAWERGYDVKFGLAAFVMQAFCMAPISALGVVAMFFLLRRLFDSERQALVLALLYAFATPVFFRAGTLNHNMMLGHVALISFALLWETGDQTGWAWPVRVTVAGLLAGLCLLLDYSGVFFLLGLFVYAWLRDKQLSTAVRFAAAATPPVLLLWFYQWQSFGHPFYPGQHWMPAVDWTSVEQGYRGLQLPQARWLERLLFDPAWGLFTSCPLMLAAPAAFFVRGVRGGDLPRRELDWSFGLCLVVYLFFSGLNYNEIMSNSGFRYLAPVLPFLFLPAAAVLRRMPPLAAWALSLASLTVSWCLAMHRDVERGLGVLDPILHVFIGGFELPALTTLSRIEGMLGEHIARGVSPLPLFALTAAALYLIWSPRFVRSAR